METSCVFCDRGNFEERLAGEDENFWTIATLGQITNGGYLLLVPKNHTPCIGTLEPSDITHIGPLVRRIQEAQSAEYGAAHGFIFEHGIVGQTVKHAHIHIVPAQCKITQRVKTDFPSHKIVELLPANTWTGLKNLYNATPTPYLLWHEFGAWPRVCLDPPAPPQYLRIAVADALGRPERANWRDIDPGSDRKLWSETVTRMKPYFE